MKKYSQHHRDGLGFFIKENSWIARLAARKLHSNYIAIVLGKTIHLWNVDAHTFLTDEQWVSHELCHIRQFQRHGNVGFVYRYLLESMKKGYHKNKYEAEARKAEQEMGSESEVSS